MDLVKILDQLNVLQKIELNLEAVHSTEQNCKFYRSIFGFCEDDILLQSSKAVSHSERDFFQ